MIAMDNGDVFISGQMYTNTDFWGEGTLVKSGIGTDGFLARVSGDGHLLWNLNLTGLPVGEGTVSELVYRDEVLYVGYSNWMISYVMVFGMDGNLIETVVQEDASVISGLDIDPEGNLYTAGSCAGYLASFQGEDHPAPFTYTTYLVKYNSEFEFEWVKYIEDVTCTFPQVRTNSNGDIYFAGHLMFNPLFDTIQVNGPAWAYDFFLARLDAQGNFLWVTECPETLTGDASVSNMRFLDTDPEGNPVMLGFTRGLVDWGNGVVSDVTGNYQDLLIWNFNSDRSVNWVKTAGGQVYDLPHSISVSGEGKAYIAGVISGEVIFDSIVIETPDGVDPFLASLDLDIISGISTPDKGEDLMIYPNPASGVINVFNKGNWEVYTIQNSSGKIIYSGNLDDRNGTIDISGLPAGLYFLRLQKQDGSGSTKKLLKL